MKVESAEFIRSAHASGDFVRDGRPEIAFVGRSNVGKSSLMNRLLGRKGLARTSSTPGRTRAVNYFLVNRRFYFVDLPGYGYAKAGKEERREWAALVDGYFRDEPAAAAGRAAGGRQGGSNTAGRPGVRVPGEPGGGGDGGGHQDRPALPRQAGGGGAEDPEALESGGDDPRDPCFRALGRGDQGALGRRRAPSRSECNSD